MMKAANPINLTQIDHVVLRVVDLEKMVRFYQDVFGCNLERGPCDLGLAQLRAGLSLIDLVDAGGPLGQKTGAAPDHQAPNLDHLCLQVHPWDEAAIVRHLEQHQVDFDHAAPRYGATGVGPSIYLRDPEGNMVELKGL